MRCQRHLRISDVKNIIDVFELSGMAFHLAGHYGGLFVKCKFLFNLCLQPKVGDRSSSAGLDDAEELLSKKIEQIRLNNERALFRHQVIVKFCCTSLIIKQEAHQFVEPGKAPCHSNLTQSRPEVAGNVISSVAIE